ncbi:MAG: hypothetical protein QNJ54_27785 [Prochloraceae cyanobacterium]|nr:hypothetical protein [Prochloraceae cyanobacterium]
MMPKSLVRREGERGRGGEGEKVGCSKNKLTNRQPIRQSPSLLVPRFIDEYITGVHMNFILPILPTLPSLSQLMIALDR